MQHLVWHTEKRKIKDLVPYELNPRKLSEEQAERLKDSFKRFDIVEIPAIDTDNKIIAGHQRIKVLLLLGRGEEEIDVRVPNRKLTEKEFKEYNIRSNINLADWDIELLKDIEIDILSDTGIFATDFGDIWNSNLGIEDDDFDVEKELEKIKTPKTKLGDLYQLGDHKLLCGDSTDTETVKKLVGKELVDMLYFDSPYNIGLDYNKGVGTNGKYGGKKTKDNKSDAEYKQFLSQVLKNGLEVAKPDCHVFSWCDETFIGLLQEIYQDLGIENKRVCLWIKNNANMTPQIAFNKVYEPCVYGVRGKPYLADKVTNINEVLNKEIGTGNRVPDDILDLLNIWLAKRVAGQDYEHPTEKPPTLHEKPLRRCTKPGDLVLDLYGGSGSTLIACEQLKRKALLCEIEPIFCDLIIRRYEKLTGGRAKKCN